MNVHVLHAPPTSELAESLRRFELSFDYPLGTATRFRIDHGEDYSRFFRSMGCASIYVAEVRGEIVGTLACVVRELLNPEGIRTPTPYLCDLKAVRGGGAGRVLHRLADAALTGHSKNHHAAFAIVMNGTARNPAQYSGRLGIPRFDPLSTVHVLRLTTIPAPTPPSSRPFQCDAESVIQCLARLSHGRFAIPAACPEIRARFKPVHLILPDQSACGTLEDTLDAKRLIHTDGTEILSAHLSNFAFASTADGVALLSAALEVAASRGLHSLFTSLSDADTLPLDEIPGVASVQIAPATVFGTGLPTGVPWNVNTSEI
jgi:hypothetical protein